MSRCEANIKFNSMLYYLQCSVCVAGAIAGLFFLAAFCICKDRKLTAESGELHDDAMQANPGETNELLPLAECGDFPHSTGEAGYSGYADYTCSITKRR